MVTKTWATACQDFSLVFQVHAGLSQCRLVCWCSRATGWAACGPRPIGGQGSSVWVSTEQGCSAQPLQKLLNLNMRINASWRTY